MDGVDGTNSSSGGFMATSAANSGVVVFCGAIPHAVLAVVVALVGKITWNELGWVPERHTDYGAHRHQNESHGRRHSAGLLGTLVDLDFFRHVERMYSL